MNYSKMQLLYDKKKAVALGKIFDIGLKAIRENNWVKVDACAKAHKMISKQVFIIVLPHLKMGYSSETELNEGQRILQKNSRLLAMKVLYLKE